MQSEFSPRPWMTYVLCAAGIYNLVWGATVVFAPDLTLRSAGLETPIDYPQIWQCLGMVIGVYGVGYLVAAADPFRHWLIVFVGLLGKLLGPVGLVVNLLDGSLPTTMLWTILLNDLVWWIPFTAILWGALRHHQAATTIHAATLVEDDPMRELIGSTGHSLQELTADRPQLVVFLRHSGCTFCREALADLQEQRADIEATGSGIVIVLVDQEPRAAEFLARYGLEDLPRFSDPHCRLYRQFGLELGGFRELLGLRVWLRGVKACLLNGHGVGRVSANPFQMPGAFVLRGGSVLAGFQHEAASDRPDYLRLVREACSSSVGESPPERASYVSAHS